MDQFLKNINDEAFESSSEFLGARSYIFLVFFHGNLINFSPVSNARSGPFRRQGRRESVDGAVKPPTGKWKTAAVERGRKSLMNCRRFRQVYGRPKANKKAQKNEQKISPGEAGENATANSADPFRSTVAEVFQHVDPLSITRGGP